MDLAALTTTAALSAGPGRAGVASGVASVATTAFAGVAVVDEVLAELPGSGLWVLAAMSAVAWLVGCGLVTWWTRPRLPEPGPSGDELGEGTLALANFLVNRASLTPSAVSAVVLDLAARRVLAVEEIGDGRQLVRYFPARAAALSLPPVEAQVLELVRARVGAGNTVPVGELTLGSAPSADRWWRDFGRQVVAEGRALGLLRHRWPAGVQAAMALSLLVPALLMALGIESGDARQRLAGATGESTDLGGGFAIAALCYAAVLVFGSSRLRAWATTAKGDAVTARWLGARAFFAEQPGLVEAPPAAVVVRGRHLAAAVALGVAGVAAAMLPIGPQRDDVAWVQRGGLWREVRLRYPTSRVRSYGPAASVLLAAGAAVVALVGLYVYLWYVRNIVADLLDAVGRGGLPAPLRYGLPALFIVVPSLFGLVGALKLWAALREGARTLSDWGRVEEIVGPVLRAPWKLDDEGRRVPSGFIAVDDGHSDELNGWYCPALQVSQGDRVRLQVTPRSGHVRRAERC